MRYPWNYGLKRIFWKLEDWIHCNLLDTTHLAIKPTKTETAQSATEANCITRYVQQFLA